MKSASQLLFLLLVMTTSQLHAATQQDTIPAHKTFILQSKQLNEPRVINVWTPPGYEGSGIQLPVMYMADGGIQEDFPHIANTMADLIRSESIPPMILVGIENTQRRRDLTGFTEVKKDKKIAPIVGGSAQFRAFIKEELFPEIEKQFRTTGKKGILGESLSGLFVMETFFVQPEMFDYYIAFDPSLWWNDHYLVKTAKENVNKTFTSPKTIWFAGSDAVDIYRYTEELATVFKSVNNKSLNWKYSPEPNEQHATIFRTTKVKALQWALGTK